MGKKSWLILPASAILGLLAVLQAKAVLAGAGGTSLDPAGGQPQALMEEKAKLEADIQLLNDKITGLEKDNGEVQARLKETGDALLDAQRRAGMTELTGKGLILTISPRTYSDNGVSRIVRVISDVELLQAVNELNAAGAEAISANGQRLISVTAIRLAGDFININRVPTAMPYEIRALGDPVELDAAMRLYGGVVDRLSEFYEVKTERSDSLNLPAFKGTVAYRYAAVPMK